MKRSVGERAVAEYYDEMQRFYERFWDHSGLHYGLHDDSTRDHRAAIRAMDVRVERALGLAPGARILDAGCGIGGTSIYLASRARHRVLGLTLSPEQLRRAKARARRLSVAAEFRLGSYTATGEPDESFDGAFGIESICYATPPSSFFTEAHRILRPRGRLVIADGFATETPTPPQAADLRAFCEGFALSRLSTLQETVTSAEQSGFIVESADDVSRHVLPSAARIRRLSYLGVVLYRMARVLPERPAIWRAHCLAGLAQERLLREGGMRYCIVSGYRV